MATLRLVDDDGYSLEFADGHTVAVLRRLADRCGVTLEQYLRSALVLAYIATPGTLGKTASRLRWGAAGTNRTDGKLKRPSPLAPLPEVEGNGGGTDRTNGTDFNFR